MHFSRDGQGQLELLVMRTTIQETAVTGVSANSRIGGDICRKIRQSRMPKRTI
jgi:hypothetical protein